MPSSRLQTQNILSGVFFFRLYLFYYLFNYAIIYLLIFAISCLSGQFLLYWSLPDKFGFWFFFLDFVLWVIWECTSLRAYALLCSLFLFFFLCFALSWFAYFLKIEGMKVWTRRGEGGETTDQNTLHEKKY